MEVGYNKVRKDRWEEEGVGRGRWEKAGGVGGGRGRKERWRGWYKEYLRGGERGKGQGREKEWEILV